MLLVKKYAPSEDTSNKVKLVILAPVETMDDGTHVVLTVDEYADLNRDKMYLDSMVASEIRKIKYASLRDSCSKHSRDWEMYNKKLKGATMAKLRIVRRVIHAIAEKIEEKAAHGG